MNKDYMEDLNYLVNIRSEYSKGAQVSTEIVNKLDQMINFIIDAMNPETK